MRYDSRLNPKELHWYGMNVWKCEPALVLHMCWGGRGIDPNDLLRVHVGIISTYCISVSNVRKGVKTLTIFWTSVVDTRLLILMLSYSKWGVKFTGKYVVSLAKKIHTENVAGNFMINMAGLGIGNGIIAPEHSTLYANYLYQVRVTQKIWERTV